VSLVVFLITEFTVKHPLIELSLFRYFNFAVANSILFIFGLGMFGSTFLLPLYLQNSLGYTAFQAGSVFLPVGIIQGVFSPLSGFLADRVNPKLPAIVGIVFLALSLYLNSFLSLFSEHAQIMLSLYFRGLGLGLVFTPLSAIALSEIPRHKMAQASGLFNVIRQIGGSFGIAILATMLSHRVTYHAAMDGQAVDQDSPAFRHAVAGLSHFVQQNTGGTPALAAMRAKALLAGHLGAQAFVQSVNDDFFIAAAITMLGAIPIFFLRTPGRGAGYARPAPPPE